MRPRMILICLLTIILAIISGCSRSKPSLKLPEQVAPTPTHENTPPKTQESTPIKMCEFHTTGKEPLHYRLGFEERPDGKENLRLWRAVPRLGNPKDEQWFEVSTFVADYVPKGKNPNKIPLVKSWTNGGIWLLFEVANGTCVTQEQWELSSGVVSVKKVK